jgi:hypothetical protein
MAAFHLIIYGRFWVITEERRLRRSILSHFGLLTQRFRNPQALLRMLPARSKVDTAYHSSHIQPFGP